MKGFLIYSLAMVLSVTAYGQSQVSNENKALAESVQQPVIEVVNDPVTTQSTAQSTNVNVQQQPVILQNQPTNNVLIQKQATTVVEDSPLVESKAEALRKQRIEMEQNTEAMIVEKLEAERIKAEQERARKLIEGLDTNKQQQNKALEDLKKQEDAAAAQTAVAVPVATDNATLIGPQQQQQGGVQVIAPQDSVVIQQNQVQDVNNQEEQSVEAVATPVIEIKEELDAVETAEKSKSDFFLGLDLGFTNYDLDNVNTLGTLGVKVGVEFDSKYIVEGGYAYSRFDIESVDQPGLTYFDPYYGSMVYYPVITEMRQHNFTGAFKYKFINESRFAPYAGGLVSITYRDYDIVQDPVGYATRYQGNGSSLAMDLGVLAGADLKMTEKFALNFDLRYVFNVSYDVETDGFETSRIYDNQFGGEVIEEAGYWQIFVGGKLTF